MNSGYLYQIRNESASSLLGAAVLGAAIGRRILIQKHRRRRRQQTARPGADAVDQQIPRTEGRGSGLRQPARQENRPSREDNFITKNEGRKKGAGGLMPRPPLV